MKSFDEVPSSIVNAFGDLRRFEEQLRHEFKVGEILEPGAPYEQLADISKPEWCNNLRDPGTGLLLPAMIAIQAIVASEIAADRKRNPTHADIGSITLIRSLQIPSDDIGPFIVKQDVDNFAGGMILANSLTTAMPIFKLLLEELGIVAEKIATRSLKHSLNSNLPGLYGQIHPTHSMHIDSATTGELELYSLSSTNYPTLQPIGTVNLSQTVCADYKTYQPNDIIDVDIFDESSLTPVADANRIGLMTGFTAHTAAFGDHVARCIDPELGYATRIWQATYANDIK